METVVVERLFPEPIEVDEIEEMKAAAAHCFEMRDVEFVRTFIAPDRKRMICVYRAPDAEAVREANRHAGAPFEAVWTATVELPPAG